MMVVPQQTMGVGQAITVGQCYQRVDEVQLAIDMYNDTGGYERMKSNKKSNRKMCRRCSFRSSSKHSSSSSSILSRHTSEHQQSKNQSCCLYRQLQNEERCSQAALKLAHAYKCLLKELDRLEDEDGISVDDDLVSCVRQTNDQLFHINNSIIRSQQRSGYTVTPNSTQELSLDALEEFLGTLMIEAETKEVEEKKGNLEEGSKYKLVMPVLTRIGKMISQHPKQQFESYHEHLGKLEAAIRVGERNVDTSEERIYQNSDSESSESSQNLEPKSSCSSRSRTPDSSISSQRSAAQSVKSSQNLDEISWAFSQNLSEESLSLSECSSRSGDSSTEDSIVKDSCHEDSSTEESIAEDSIAPDSFTENSLFTKSLITDDGDYDDNDDDDRETMPTLSQSMPSLHFATDEEDGDEENKNEVK